MIGSNALQISLGNTVSAYMSLGMTIITLFNPIVTMCFVRPYRKALLNILSGRRGRVSGNSGSSPRAGPPVLAKPAAPHGVQPQTGPTTVQSATMTCQKTDPVSCPESPEDFILG
ncbi:hypothetical protein AAVH_21977 [Aphelenchoides avenae]|nr:hypothetical protein AAVH_21977 [Aphelenchus avenae]